MTTRYATVFCGVTLPDGTVYAGQPVPVTLNTPTAFTTDGLTEIVRTAYAKATASGFEITLPINDDIDPAGTTWKLRVARLSWTFQLHAAHAGTRVALRSVLVEDPTNPAPMVAGVTQAQLDAAIAAALSGGTGGTVTAIDGGSATSTATGSIDGGSAAA